VQTSGKALAAVVMSIPSRHSVSRNIHSCERTFFVTSSILGKRNLLQSDRSARLFLEVLYHYREQKKCLLHEFVVMPDHFHVLITVPSDMSIERAVQLIKGGFAYRAARELGFRAPIWQKGFSELRTLDAEAFAGQCEYIRNNPVARHLVKRASEVPYSSANVQYVLDAPWQRMKPLVGSALLRHA
jgi:putative transposase